MNAEGGPLRRAVELLASAKVGLILNVCLYCAVFYRWVFVDNKHSIGRWPIEIAVPGLLGLLYLAYYAMEHPSDSGDRAVGRLMTYVFMGVGVLGIFGF
jgi:hypothetical protein